RTWARKRRKMVGLSRGIARRRPLARLASRWRKACTSYNLAANYAPRRKPMLRRSTMLVFAAASVAAFSAPAIAADAIPPAVAAAVSDAGRPAEDKERDADRKPAESAAFGMVKPGDKVLELFGGGGYFTRILSKTVGANGKVYVTVPEAQVQRNAQAADKLK